MNMRYDKEDDILMIWLSKEPVDYAEQSKDIIAHFSSKRGLVLLEILSASKFLKSAAKSLPQKTRQQISI